MSTASQKRSRGVSVNRPFEILGRREGDGVHEEIELAVPRLGDLAEDTVDVLVGADVAGGHELGVDRGREFAHVAFDPLALKGESELGPLVRQAPRDRPGDRPLVRDSHDQSAFSRES